MVDGTWVRYEEVGRIVATERKYEILDNGKIAAAVKGMFDVLEAEELTVTECIIACRAVCNTFEKHYPDVVKILGELKK